MPSAPVSADLAMELQTLLSSEAQVLTDPSSSAFQASMSRWTDINKQTPTAILLPACEADVQQMVSLAIGANVPLAVKSGGNSPWSTTGSPGWILDLSLLNYYSLNIENQTATLQPVVLSKTINTAVQQHGFCIQSPGSALVSCVGFLLGGGSSYLNGLYGMAVDSLVSARVVTSKGTKVCSEQENQELFWAIKGAGQFFGVVTEVTMKIYRLKEEEGPLSWTVVFTAGKMKEVAGALEVVSRGEQVVRSPGLVMVMALPGFTKPGIMVSIMHFRPEDEAEKIMAPLLALGPVQQIKEVVPWGNMTDSADMLAVHGGIKTLHSCGMKEFDGKKFEKSLELWERIDREVPGAKGCTFMMNWFSLEGVKKKEGSSAWSHRDMGVWSMHLINAEDEASHNAALALSKEYFEMCQANLQKSEKALFPNHWRGDDIERRFRGEETVKKLRELKALWDPEGVFTKQFLQG